MGKKVKKIILFDLDGTLIDSTEAIIESFYHALRIHKERTDVLEHEITSSIGHPLSVMFERIGIEKIDEHIQTYKEHYRKISCAKTILLPHAYEAIEAAASFARLGIVTTKTAQYSRELMEHFGVMDRFEVLIGFENVQNLKPHPEPILTALEQMNHREEDVWMIGDTRLDLEASQRAGIKAVGVLSGYDTHEHLAPYDFSIHLHALDAVRHIEKTEGNVGTVLAR